MTAAHLQMLSEGRVDPRGGPGQLRRRRGRRGASEVPVFQRRGRADPARGVERDHAPQQVQRILARLRKSVAFTPSRLWGRQRNKAPAVRSGDTRV